MIEMTHHFSTSPQTGQALFYPSVELRELLQCHNALAQNIYWRFGVSEKRAHLLASDIYKIIEA